MVTLEVCAGQGGHCSRRQPWTRDREDVTRKSSSPGMVTRNGNKRKDEVREASVEQSRSRIHRYSARVYLGVAGVVWACVGLGGWGRCVGLMT